MTDSSKDDPEYAAVYCMGMGAGIGSCGQVKISREEYMAQLSNADSVWKCPNCGSPAVFDQRYYEEHNVPKRTGFYYIKDSSRRKNLKKRKY